MTSPNAAFSIVHGEQLPFNPAAHSTDVTEDFTVEISLLSAQFKTQNSAAVALDSSSTAAAAASSTAPKKENKPVTKSIYALPEATLNPKHCIFKNATGKAAAAAITVSCDPAAEDEAAWAAGACVATLDKQFQRLPDGVNWRGESFAISVFQAKPTGRDRAIQKDHEAKKALCVALLNLADFVSTAEPAAECVRQVTCSSHPPLIAKCSLTLQVKTTPSNRHLAARAPKSPEQIASAASSNLGNAQSGKELLFKLAPNCSFASGCHVGIAEEEAWRGQGVMLLHTLSSLQACEPSAPNYLGQVTSAHAAAGCVAIRVKCPEISKTKNDKTIQESRFGWLLLSACSSALKQGIDLQSEPYASFDLQNEPIFCIFPSSDAAEADDKIAHQEAKDVKVAADYSAKQEAYERTQEIKKQAMLLSQTAFEMSSEEMGMVRLRRGFLACQPYISAVLKLLMSRSDWYGSASGDACIRFFRSRNGPWDVFSMFNFLLRCKTPNNPDTKDIFGLTADAIGPSGDVAERDQFRERLQLLFGDIFCVRNWWAHLGAGSLDCNRALKSARDFVQILADSELLRCSSASHPDDASAVLAKMDQILDVTQAAHFTIDDIAYVLFLRASRHICKFCTEIYGTLRCSLFSEEMLAKLRDKSAKTSRRQSEAIEVSDVSTVLAALFNSDPHVSFDCSVITATRNGLSHASEDRNQIILVAMALGAIARVGSVIVDRCLDPSCLPKHASGADAERAKLLQAQGREMCGSVALYQAELLARCDFLDVDKLIAHIHDGHESAITACEFSQLISAAGQTNAAKFRAVKFLLDRKLRGVSDAPENDERLQCAAGDSQVREQEKKVMRSLLYTIVRIPPERRRTLDAAVAWLVGGNVSNSGLLQSSGLRLLIEDDDDQGFFSATAANDTRATEAAAAFQSHVKLLKNVHKVHSDAIKFKREYEMACFKCEKYRVIEEQFCAAHPQPASPDLSQETGCWRLRVAFCAEAERAAEAAQLLGKAEQVLTALNGQQAAIAEFERSSDAEALAGVKLFLQRSARAVRCQTFLQTHTRCAQVVGRCGGTFARLSRCIRQCARRLGPTQSRAARCIQPPHERDVHVRVLPRGALQVPQQRDPLAKQSRGVRVAVLPQCKRAAAHAPAARYRHVKSPRRG